MSSFAPIKNSSPVRTRPYPAWPRSTPAAQQRLMAALNSGHWWQSGHGAAEELEARLAEDHQAVACVAVANGTVALEVALRALHIGPGDEVLVPATTFVSTASAVVAVGARPVPVDVCAETWCLDPDAAEPAVTARTRALIVVHLAGQPADLDAARALCDRHGIALIEDSAQATTAEWRGARVGTAGDLTTFSFQAAKLLPGGDGGAVVIRDDRALAGRVELLANCGRPRGSGTYHFTAIGTNARISEFAAALVLGHLPEYEDLWRRRDRNAQALTERLRAVDPGLVIGTDPAVTRHDHYMFMLRLPEPARAAGLTNTATAAALTAQGIPVSVMYPPWSDNPLFAVQGARTPVAGEAGAAGLWLHHRLLLDDDVADDVARAMVRVLDVAEV
ncbi:DegT/DnrJ/EryC1/StrS family aminotransferase [Actinoplanes sp. NPDC020271]|uniref:DegT/DnrJ/EryC1/StrS family aminotransferase n=1 Tax=Actinoplanes sp. NPDC020271 TaxID=3363896 RepID=UPI0037A9388C